MQEEQAEEGGGSGGGELLTIKRARTALVNPQSE